MQTIIASVQGIQFEIRYNGFLNQVSSLYEYDGEGFEARVFTPDVNIAELLSPEAEDEIVRAIQQSSRE